MNVTASTQTCCRPGCRRSAQWLIELAGARVSPEPDWVRSFPLRLCDDCFCLVRSWGWGVEVHGRPLL